MRIQFIRNAVIRRHAYRRHAYWNLMETWSEREYADPVPYLRHRGRADRLARAAARAGRPAARPRLRRRRPRRLPARDRVPRRGRQPEDGRGGALEGPRRSSHADLNDFEPDTPVAATTIFRAIYYTRDRREFLRHVAGYTERKLVFDLNPRQYRLEDVLADLRAAGLAACRAAPVLRPADARAARRRSAAALVAAERSGPLARLALRYRFTYLVAASK